jgi:glycosyltransferase involved in cell wall biosynthesis
MRRRRLLFVSTRFLFPANSGGKVRSRDILRALKGGRFHITLVSPAPLDTAQCFAEELSRVCDRFVSWPETKRGAIWAVKRVISLLSPMPVAVESDDSEAGRRIVVAELARRPDLVVADFVHSTILLPKPIAGASVLFTHNVEAEIFQRQEAVEPNPIWRAIWKSQERKMRRFEDNAALRFDAVVAVSERDAKHFRNVCEQQRVFPIPTGVDTDYFQYHPPRVEVPPGGGTVVFVGSMDWLPNVDGLRYLMDLVWPRIISARALARMVVVGHSPPRVLVKAARERGLEWTFTGFVDDVRPHITGAHVYVIPLRVGGGTRIKAYEPMALGCPVVSTALGIEGLPVVSDRHCIITDSADGFATAVITMLNDLRVRLSFAESARNFVEENFSTRTAAEMFENACWQAMKFVEDGRRGGSDRLDVALERTAARDDNGVEVFE